MWTSIENVYIILLPPFKLSLKLFPQVFTFTYIELLQCYTIKFQELTFNYLVIQGFNLQWFRYFDHWHCIVSDVLLSLSCFLIYICYKCRILSAPSSDGELVDLF